MSFFVKALWQYLDRNGLEFIVAFLGATMDSKIGAPFKSCNYGNPEEFNFYLNDLQSKVIVVSKGTVKQEKEAEIVEVTRKFGCYIVELYSTRIGLERMYEHLSPDDNYNKVVFSSLKNALFLLITIPFTSQVLPFQAMWH